MKAIKIWNSVPTSVDEYVDFIGRFAYKTEERVVLKLSCDGAFSFTVNGILAGFGESADYPDARNYYSFDVTEYCRAENELLITVWHYGENTSTYIKAPAHLAFSVECGKEKLLQSGKKILCRPNPYYKAGYCKQITGQLGFSYCYDSTATDTKYYDNAAADTNFYAVTEYGKLVATDRKIAPLKLGARPNMTVIKTDTGFIMDMGEETVGFLDLELYSGCRQKLLITYGEHLRDGHVPRRIGSRDFSVEYVAHVGDNRFIGAHRRIAGRYVEVFSEDLSERNITFLGIRPTTYPISKKAHSFDDDLDRRIYDVSVKTLISCMHEHYEDCPWREQALYAMDSRNQMLCDYTAFRGTAFQRHSLVLIAEGLRQDNFIEITAPGGTPKLPIPFFSLVFPVQVTEYVENTGDRSILKEVGPAIEAILQNFTSRIDENGLIAAPEAPCWNFYEWSDGNDHCDDITGKQENKERRYDLILNCMYVHSMTHADRLFGRTTDLSEMKEIIRKNFYSPEKGMFRSSIGKDTFGQLGNAFALLIGLGEKDFAERVISCDGMTPITLSMLTFLYDGLLKQDPAYGEWILNDIRRRYQKMLDAGATTFWETELGAPDFDGAGSLCHGWSAMPAYYLPKLLNR